MTTEHVHISKGITKLGADIPSVSLPPVCTCRPGAPCLAKCYARKGRWRFGHNKDLLRRNFDIWNSDPESFQRDVFISAFHSKFFRWHSSGDIPDEKYLNMMVKLAQELPDTKFLCFTKKFEIINSYLTIHKSFPENLRIVFSAWGSFVPENPFQLPVAYVRFKDGTQGHIPEEAIPCMNYCGECVMSGCSCWDLKNGQSVCFNEH